MTGNSDAGDNNRNAKHGGPRTAAGKAKVRLNAQKHQLFAKSVPSHHISSRACELAAGYQGNAKSSEERGYLQSLAEVQAHIEHIRRVRTALWNEALKTAQACLDEMSDLTVFKAQTEHPSVRKMRLALDLPEVVPDPVLELVQARIRSIALEKVAKQLFTLAGYERRAQGLRRKLMRKIMRIRVDQKWKNP